MGEWQCSNCFKNYTFEEFMELERVPVKPKEIEKYGYNKKCGCGCIFHKNTWRFHTVIKIGWFKYLLVFTVHLGLNHSFEGGELWYETMVFESSRKGKPKKNSGDLYCNRYYSKEEAIDTHGKIVLKLRSGNLEVLR